MGTADVYILGRREHEEARLRRQIAEQTEARMRQLEEEDKERYERQFSRYVKEGIKADNLQSIYEQAHEAIRKNPEFLSAVANLRANRADALDGWAGRITVKRDGSESFIVECVRYRHRSGPPDSEALYIDGKKLKANSSCRVGPESLLILRQRSVTPSIVQVRLV